MNAATPSRTCGLIGLGLMGRGMGLSLQRANYQLHVVAHRNRSVVDELVAVGAQEHATAQSLAEHCDTVLLCLPGIEPTERVLFGEHGWATHARPGHLVIDCSTQTPAAAKGFHEKLKLNGVGYVDAPLTGGPADAVNANLQALVSGDASMVERALPILETMCQRTTRFDKPGSAQEAKLVNNFLAFGSLALMAEALAAAQAAGVDRATLLEAVRHGGGQSRAFERMGQHLASDPTVTSKATLHTVEKDVRYFKVWAEEMGCGGPMATVVHSQFLSMLSRGLGEFYTPDYVRQVARDFGQNLHPE